VRAFADGSGASYLHLEKPAGETDCNRIYPFACTRSRPGVVRGRNALLEVAYADLTNGHELNIDSHIKRLRKKFMAHDSEFNVVETLYGVGYRYKEA
jgi:hypothetical protein